MAKMTSPDQPKPSIISELKKLEFYTLSYWTIFNILPAASWIGYQHQWLSDKNFSQLEIEKYFQLTGWFNLLLIPFSVGHGMVVEKISAWWDQDFKKTVILNSCVVVLINMVSCLLTSLISPDLSFKLTYICYFLRVLFIWSDDAERLWFLYFLTRYPNVPLDNLMFFNCYTNCNMSAILQFPPEILGQGIGFNVTLTGLTYLSPMAIYLTGISIDTLQLVCCGLVISSLVHCLAVHKIQ